MVRRKESKKTGSPEYICPYCFSSVDLTKLHYLCKPNCAKMFAQQTVSTRDTKNMKYVSQDGQDEIDYEKSVFYGKDPQGPDAIVAKQHIVRDGNPPICDVCKRPVYTRACPVCHNQIPPGAEEDGNRIFVILGPKGVGKSHYIAVLINQLKNYVSTEFNGVLNAANDGTTMKYRNMYYHRLFEEKRKLLPTKSFDVSDEAREPLIYYFRIFDGDKPRVFTFAFFDTAGEDLVSSGKMVDLAISSFVAKAAGIVYLVDPLQIKYINTRIHVDNKPPVGPDVSDVLNNICQIIRTNNNIKAKGRIDIPLAVCLTKCDVLMKSAENEEEDKVLFSPSSSIHIPREKKVYDQENFDQIDVELEEYMRRTVGEDFLQMVNGFEEHCYFAVSALGCNPSGSALPRGVSPFRVEDPFIWLLNREGLR